MRTPPNAADIESRAAKLYTVYCAAVGGKAFDGAPLPPWHEFAADVAKYKQTEGWRAVAEATFEQ